MRGLVSLFSLAIVTTSPLTAGDTEAWLTHTDVQVDVAGLRVQSFLPAGEASICAGEGPNYRPVPDLRCLRWPSAPSVDASGAIYFTTDRGGLGFPPDSATLWRTTRDGNTERVIHVDPRLDPRGVWIVARFDGFVVDSVHGTISLLLRSTCLPAQTQSNCRGTGTTQVVRISGLPALPFGQGADR